MDIMAGHIVESCTILTLPRDVIARHHCHVETGRWLMLSAL